MTCKTWQFPKSHPFWMSLLSMHLDVAELILNSRAVTTTISIAPCHNSSVRRYCSKSMVWGIYLLNTLELMLDCRAVTAKTRVSPCHHGSICQDSSKSTFRGRNLLNIVQLTLDSSAVTAKSWASPCHHGSICQDGSKGIVCCKNLLNSVQRILDCSAVATKLWISLGDNPVTSYTPQSKGALCCSYLWLLCNSSNAASISKPRILKKFCLIQKAPIRGSQPQKTLPPKPVVQRFSDQQRCHTAGLRQFHTFHLARTLETPCCYQPQVWHSMAGSPW